MFFNHKIKPYSLLYCINRLAKQDINEAPKPIHMGVIG